LAAFDFVSDIHLQAFVNVIRDISVWQKMIGSSHQTV